MGMGGNKFDAVQFIGRYPDFLIRFIIVVIIILVSYTIIMSLRSKAFLKMMTDKDSVTGLMNWEEFKKNAQAAITKSNGMNFALIQFDIDKFKVVNDLYGIDGGNNLLKMIAMEIVSMLDKNEMATRFYADVFCLLISYHTEDEITGFINKINERIKNCIKSINLTLIFGIYRIEEDISVNLMIDRAAFARNSVKGNSVKFYSFF